MKVTVATPYSLGNDTKTKVFWVEPCTTTPTVKSPDSPDTPPTTTSHAAPPPSTSLSTPPGASSHSIAVQGSTTTTERNDSDTPVPTAVDAGEDASALPEWARSPLPLTAVAGGLVLVAAGLARRARNGA